jgi:hypothetical protein
MVAEADRFADEDKKRREAVEAKNGAESLVYQTEKQLKEFEDKVGFFGGGVVCCCLGEGGEGGGDRAGVGERRGLGMGLHLGAD